MGFAIADLALVAAFLLWALPKLHVSGLSALTSEARFDKENESRKTLSQIIGGLFVIVSLFSAAQTLELSQKTLEVSQKQEEQVVRQIDITHQGQLADRFTKAIEQLGAVKDEGNDKGKPKLEVRLGGIYALAYLA